MEDLATHDRTDTHTGPQRDVEEVVEPVGGTPCRFPRCSGVDVRIERDGNPERACESIQELHILPSRLRGCRDRAVAGGVAIQLERAEGTHAQRLEALPGVPAGPKEPDHFPEGALRIPRGYLGHRPQVAGSGSHRAHELRAARLDSGVAVSVRSAAHCGAWAVIGPASLPRALLRGTPACAPGSRA